MTPSQLDLELFRHLNASAALAGWRLDGAIAVAQALVYLVPVLLLGLWIFGRAFQRLAAVSALVAGGGALLVNQLVALAWYRPRPFAAGIGHSFLRHVADSSFPSDHVTVLAATGFALWSSGAWRTRPLGVVLLGAALVVGWARVLLGIHYPGDVVGGFAVGALAVVILRAPAGQWLVSTLARALDRLRKSRA